MAKATEKEKPKTIQHLFHVNNVERRKKEGWKVVKPYIDNHKRETDLVLMEK